MATRRRRWTVLTPLVVATLAAVGASACDGNGDESSADPSGVDVDVGDDVPADFPADAVPLPDETVASSSTTGRGGERVWTILYQVDDVVAAAERYRDELAAAGFEVEASFSAGDEEGDLESFTAVGDDYIVTAFAGGIRGESVVSVTVSPAFMDQL
ncbi:MAG TPA: hypothetical protein VF152_01275 [Acidimicrobiia bacterium]